mmetsp:Transcript_19401/g.29796  ORF Transcript_19401/g.29796 Transcript_19401/m.29796 type:complete len:83 (-) Transcript_19401:9-257(-)
MANLLQYPVLAQKYSSSGTSFGTKAADEINGTLEDDPFAFEDPSVMSHEQLAPTSGRKQWMIRHGKRIKKKLKADKKGYIGS